MKLFIGFSIIRRGGVIRGLMTETAARTIQEAAAIGLAGLTVYQC